MNQQEPVLLQNDSLQVRILPSFGGKIASVRSVRTGEEFLLPPLRRYSGVSANAAFSESDGGGFDDCLPSVASCPLTPEFQAIPDHGDLWRVPWSVESQNGAVILKVEASSRPLRLTKTVSLNGSSLTIDYSLENLSTGPMRWLWSAHPLLLVEAGDRIILPDEIKEAYVEYSAANMLQQQTSVSWPTAISKSGFPIDLDILGIQDGATAHKLFASVGKQGWAGLYRHRARQGLVFRFDPLVLPFIGIWICYGAWPEEGAAQQYTVALEPTTSNTDSLLTAERNGTHASLEAGKSCSWRLKLELLGTFASIDMDEFRGLACEM
jgi:galactose mutarotase-like enzyme